MTPSEGPPPGRWQRLKAWLRRNQRVFWWLHSLYALGLGVLVIIFAAKGFEQARLLAATLGGAFLILVILFRAFGEGRRQQEVVERGTSKKLQFLGMTYVLKNLYQGMLFFVLPFYWRSSTLDSPNAWFVFLLGLLALLSTLDIVFDRLLMRYRLVAGAFFGVTFLACANLVLPAFLPNLPTLASLLGAVALSILAFTLLHFPLRALREGRTWVVLALVSGLALTGAYLGRHLMPPVPLQLSRAAIGLAPRPDGRLAIELTALHRDRLETLHAVSEVLMPGGQGDGFRHRWRSPGGTTEEVACQVTAQDDANELAEGRHSIERVRLASSLLRTRIDALGPIGEWVVDTVTDEGQIVGRRRVLIFE